MKYLFCVCLVQIGSLVAADGGTVKRDDGYEPNWDSLDSRPLPDWYDKAKVGIFIHWGVYAVPSFGNEWFWNSWNANKSAFVGFMQKNYKPGFTYQDFGRDFTAEFYDPAAWAKLFKDSGAKYVVLTSKHHEGYTLWPSTYSYSWNAMDVGAHRDLLGDLAEAVRNEGLRMGFYYSLLEWFNPKYVADKASHFVSTIFVDNKIHPELKELVETYEPDIVWSDGEWEASYVYWKSPDFLAWLYNESPVRETVVVNDRWGNETQCRHGGFYNCHDRYNPGVLQEHKWENAMTIDKKSWGFRRNTKYDEVMTAYELIKTIVITVSCGGNILINVGPTKDGTIAPIYQERLLNVGCWLSVNGEAIYETTPWTTQNDTLSQTWYTSKLDVVYAISLEWPSDGVVTLGSAQELFDTGATVELLGFGEVEWSSAFNSISIALPDKAKVSSDWAWVFKISPNSK